MHGSQNPSGCKRSSTTRDPNAASSAGLPAARSDCYGEDDDECFRDRRRHHVSHGDRLLSSRAPALSADVSLREWLDQPGRAVDVPECLHIFRQIVDTVNSAHSQGVVVGNVRPSCFVMSPLNRVSFIEFASCSTSGWSDSCEDSVDPGRPPTQRRGDADAAQGRRRCRAGEGSGHAVVLGVGGVGECSEGCFSSEADLARGDELVHEPRRIRRRSDVFRRGRISTRRSPV